MTRKILTFYVALIAVIGLAVYPHSAAAVNLKNHSIVEENIITLDDVFFGLSPNKGAKVLGAAPHPGTEMVLNARTLLRIAVAMDLPWRPQHAGEHVVLTRSASVVEVDMIKDALRSEIAEHGMSGSYDIAFNGALSDIILPAEHVPSVDVQSINLREASGRFDAVLVAPSKDMPLQTVRVTGMVQRMVDVPVLRTSFRGGSIIRERDLDYVSIRETQLKGGMALNASDVIGLTPRRMVLSGKPISLNDLEAPQIVGRGDLVTISYNHAGMRLTAQGKALEGGAKGEAIRVSNVASNRTLAAVITGERQVKIEGF
ncbi:MAG: flagellar basal body P-ring formation chaperone FlgA [Alphaproteobacteria bacterium]